MSYSITIDDDSITIDDGVDGGQTPTSLSTVAGLRATPGLAYRSYRCSRSNRADWTDRPCRVPRGLPVRLGPKGTLGDTGPTGPYWPYRGDGCDWCYRPAGADGADADVSALLVKANNLSDLTNAAAARTALGLGTMATATATDTSPNRGTSRVSGSAQRRRTSWASAPRQSPTPARAR